MGPEAGANGGRVVAQGTIPDIAQNRNSQIGPFLAGTADIHVRDRAKPIELFDLGTIHLSTGAIHTVKPLEVDIPKHAQKQKILFSAIKDRDDRGRVIDVVMPVTELDRANLIFERILYQGPTRQAPEREERAPSGPVRGRVEPSPDRDREPPQRPQEAPQESRSGQEQAAPQESREGPQRPPVPDRWDPPPPRSQLPNDPWEIPSKKDSRSGRDSHDTKTNSSTSRESGGMSDRPSILGRLEGYRARLVVKSRSVPAKEKTRAKPKAR